MSDNTSTTIDAALKQDYSRSTVEDLVYASQPGLAMIEKDEKGGGRNVPVIAQYGNGQGRSGTFADAQGNATAELMDDFLITWKTDYDVATITGIAVAQAKGDANSFLDALSVVIDGAFHNLSRSMGITLFRDGTGWRGQIISTEAAVNDTTITLAHSSQATNFEVNMSVEASSALGSGSRNGGAATTLAAVNRNTGVLTTSEAAWNTTITNIAAGDYLYAEGDFSSGTTAASIMFQGFNSWIPTSAPSGGESFFGVDRSVDTRLHGQRYDGSSQLIEEALIDGQSVGAVEGGKFDVCYLNHVKYRELIKAQGSKTTFAKGSRTAKGGDGDVARISFRSVVIDGDFGPIDVIADINCVYNVAWLLQSDTWRLLSLGQAPQLLELDDNKILRQASADGYEVRVGAYLNTACSAPGKNCRVTLAS